MKEAPSIKEALDDLYQFIEVVTSGEFYQDYDALIETLGKANRAFKLVSATLQPSGEQKEVIRSAINGIYGISRGDFAGGFQNKSIDKAIDKILSFGFVQVKKS